MSTETEFLEKYMSWTGSMDAEEAKMKFIVNAVDDGWSVKKRDESYMFSKKHLRDRRILRNDYLTTFIAQHGHFGSS